MCVYFKDGAAVGSAYEFISDMGKSATVESSSPYDVNYNDLSYDDYEIFINRAPPYILIWLPADSNRCCFGFNNTEQNLNAESTCLPVIMQKQVLFDNYGRFLFRRRPSVIPTAPYLNLSFFNQSQEHICQIRIKLGIFPFPVPLPHRKSASVLYKAVLPSSYQNCRPMQGSGLPGESLHPPVLPDNLFRRIFHDAPPPSEAHSSYPADINTPPHFPHVPSLPCIPLPSACPVFSECFPGFQFFQYHEASLLPG